MDGLQPVDDRTLPDVFVRGVPMQITRARGYLFVKHMASWGADVTLHPWDTWDTLGDRVSQRLGQHLWHPSHWDRYYAGLVDVPASTPGAVPLTRAEVRRARQSQTDLFARSVEHA